MSTPNPTSTSTSAPPPNAPNGVRMTAVATNGVRLTAVAQKLASHFHGTLTLNPTELFQLCYALARGIDYALSSNDVPGVADSIPVLVKKAFQYKNEPALRSALMVLMISVKNACKNSWFQEDDRKEILAMADELSGSFCLSVGLNTETIDATVIINEITPRFYPQIKLTRLLVSFEAKIGYDILMSDFFIQRNLPANEKIRLYVIQRGNLETSSCIAQPPTVSFLVNGKGVERRNNTAMETGPQVPTDITKMLKYGTNIIQAAGYFSGNYILAIAFTSMVNMVSPPVLENYTEPSAGIESDSEIIEGPSTVSLNCPISFNRIKTPVKGCQCRHRQCFDYDNYMEMNSRKPIWRCPHCNRPVCALDIRLDQKMVKILEAVDTNASHITILSDGSWKKVEEHDKCQQGSGPPGGESSDAMRDAAHDIIDLTSEENDVDEPIEVEDIKPVVDGQNPLTAPEVNTPQPSRPRNNILHAAEDNAWLRNTFSPAYGTLESLLPDSLRGPFSTSSSSSQPHLQHGGNVRTPSIPRNTMQVPGSMQALPSLTENPSRRIGSGMMNATNYANRSSASLQLPSTSTVTVAVNGNFASALGSVPSSLGTPQNQATANRPHQPMMSMSAQRPVPPTPSTQRVANSFRIPPSVLNSVNSSPNNVSAQMHPHQPLFPPVRIPTSINGSLRTHNQPSSAPLQESALGSVQQNASASVLPEMPPEQGWRPTGRMRGSLTGEAYSAALNHYADQPNLQNVTNGNPNYPNPNPNPGGSNAQSTPSQAGRRWY
ncbi:E3 SUMO-protein ligase pli1 [Rhynchospora pubera]|uniref:E3 SUMO-protein ligase pli1 n=1 Tax=Rhynchospora pubera TaxID=906938 RepID=A0AAV8G5H9_9POAL|nr:E3 SUMO-protein ligase pli1 [Rhynchospora pubera]